MYMIPWSCKVESEEAPIEQQEDWRTSICCWTRLVCFTCGRYQYDQFPKPVRCWPHRRINLYRKFCNPTAAVWKVVVHCQEGLQTQRLSNRTFQKLAEAVFLEKGCPPITAAVLCPRCQEHGISWHGVLLHWGCNWLGAYIAVGPSRSAVTCCDHRWSCHTALNPLDCLSATGARCLSAANDVAGTIGHGHLVTSPVIFAACQVGHFEILFLASHASGGVGHIIEWCERKTLL